VLSACAESGEPRWLVHDGTVLRREDGSDVLRGAIDPAARYRIQGRRTLIGGGLLRIFEPGRPERVEPLDAAAAFDAGEGRLAWVSAGQLLRDGPHGPERIGDVLGGRTRLWLGPAHGFGRYDAGEVSVASSSTRRAAASTTACGCRAGRAGWWREWRA